MVTATDQSNGIILNDGITEIRILQGLGCAETCIGSIVDSEREVSLTNKHGVQKITIKEDNDTIFQASLTQQDDQLNLTIVEQSDFNVETVGNVTID